MNPNIHPPKLLSRLRLLPYQSDFAANNSRFKIGLWARQTGKGGARPPDVPFQVGRVVPNTPLSGLTGKVELCQFTTALKTELFPRLPAAFEQRLLRIPISRDLDSRQRTSILGNKLEAALGTQIREDLHAIQRTVTQSGQIAYRAAHSAFDL